MLLALAIVLAAVGFGSVPRAAVDKIPPIAYVSVRDTHGRVVAVVVEALESGRISRADRTGGLLLGPGRYRLSAEAYGHTWPIEIPSWTELPRDLDFLAGLTQPPRLPRDVVSPAEANLVMAVADGPLTRWYVSTAEASGPFGFGWSFNYGARIAQRSDAGLEVIEADGSITTYGPLGDGYYGPGQHFGLGDVQTSNTTITDSLLGVKGKGFFREAPPSTPFFRADGGLVMYDTFLADGRLRAVAFASGQRHRIDYDGATPKAVVEATTGNPVLRFETDATGHIVAMEDADGRRFQYAYDADRLVGVTAPDGGVTRYAYDAHSRLISIAYPDGARAHFAYSEKNNWVVRMQAPGVDDRLVYGEESPHHTWTVRVDREGNRTRWDYRLDRGVTLVTRMERLDAKIARLLAELGLVEGGTADEGISLPRLLAAGVELGALGETALDAIHFQIRHSNFVTRPRTRRAAAVLHDLVGTRPDLAGKACLVLLDINGFYFRGAPERWGSVVRLDAAGKVAARYPFAGRLSPGTLTFLDERRVVVGDLEPYAYRVLDLDTGKFADADPVALAAVRGFLPDLLNARWRIGGSDFVLQAGVRSRLVHVPPDPQRQVGFRVDLPQFDAVPPDLAVTDGESLVLAGRRASVPVVSVDLANGTVRQLDEPARL